MLFELRRIYQPKLPPILKDLSSIVFSTEKTTSLIKDTESLRSLFPNTFGRPFVKGKKGERQQRSVLNVGVVLSGGPAAGGHNVIAGLIDALLFFHQGSKLFGFLGGPEGIITGSYKELTKQIIDPYRNQGGFDLIGSGRTKIETEQQLKAALSVCQTLKLDGLVVIGGDDSNTNAAVLAEYFLANGCQTAVVGVPKTIDGDLKNEHLAISFGFDTACKTYAEMIGNIARDALSTKKYYHFIRLMGRSASHITLECALATKPNIALISEEVAAKKQTLAQVTAFLCDVIEKRALEGKKYGIILIPEGLIESIHDIMTLIADLSKNGSKDALSPSSRSSFESLPETIQKQLLFKRDPHGNLNVSLIETEKLLLECTEQELKKRGSGESFQALTHFFGYEGRAGFPSNFDSNMCYSLGLNAALLVSGGFNGYMSAILHLEKPISQWEMAGIPLTALMHLESRKGKMKPVIQKTLVDLHGKPFSFFKQHREKWALQDSYISVGPIQFFGSEELTDSVPLSIR